MIDKIKLQMLRKDIDAALKQVAQDHAVIFRTGNCRFTEQKATFQLEVHDNSDGDFSTVQDAKLAEEKANLLLYAPHLAGKEFVANFTTYRVVGYQPRRRKYPVVCEQLSSGQRRLFVASYVEQLIGE